jgi:hypothetical protein
MDEPHWLITTVAGTVFGILLPYLGHGIRFIWRYRRKDRLEGEWLEYHASFAGDAVLLGGAWRIKKGFRHRLVVDFQHENDKNLRYRGLLREERGQIIAMLKLVSDDEETLCYRFVKPVGDRDAVPGLWLSYARDGKIFSGAAVLSRKPLDETEVEKLFSNTIEQQAKFPALRIKE